MVTKKKAKKKLTSKKKKVTRVKNSNKNIEKVLIDNFVSLQKVMTNMSLKFDLLTTQISELLNLFEESARTLARKDLASLEERKENRKLMETMNSILGQNKLIAKGLTLMHESANNPEIEYSIGRKNEFSTTPRVKEEEPEVPNISSQMPVPKKVPESSTSLDMPPKMPSMER